MEDGIKVTDSDREAYYRQLVPYGYADVSAAISTAKEAGKDAEKYYKILKNNSKFVV